MFGAELDAAEKKRSSEAECVNNQAKVAGPANRTRAEEYTL